MQRLRDARMIQTATQAQGQRATAGLPAMRCRPDYRAGTATHLHCPSCHSEVDIRGEQAVIARPPASRQDPCLYPCSRAMSPPWTVRAEWTLIGTLRWRSATATAAGTKTPAVQH
jgi:hypothetical protein